MQYWLMKSEPSEYSIDDLKRDGSSSWFGVRNYLARNFMRDQMQLGDKILFYHSTCEVPGVYGIAEVVSTSHPDESQFEKGKYFDPKSTREKPIWQCVDVGFVSKAKMPLTLTEMRKIPELSEMRVLQKGNRLSITPVSEGEFQIISQLL